MEKLNTPLFEIAQEFVGDEASQVASNVGELIAILKKLPADLPIKESFSDSVSVNVYNENYDNIHCSIVGVT